MNPREIYDGAMAAVKELNAKIFMMKKGGVPADRIAKARRLASEGTMTESRFNIIGDSEIPFEGRGVVFRVLLEWADSMSEFGVHPLPDEVLKDFRAFLAEYTDEEINSWRVKLKDRLYPAF